MTEQTVKFHLGNLYRKLGVAVSARASSFTPTRRARRLPEVALALREQHDGRP